MHIPGSVTSEERSYVDEEDGLSLRDMSVDEPRNNRVKQMKKSDVSLCWIVCVSPFPISLSVCGTSSPRRKSRTHEPDCSPELNNVTAASIPYASRESAGPSQASERGVHPAPRLELAAALWRPLQTINPQMKKKKTTALDDEVDRSRTAAKPRRSCLPWLAISRATHPPSIPCAKF